MQYAPTRVPAKFGGFHIPAHEYTKNAPDFTFPDKDAPKTRPVLDPNPWRRTFRGVCNTPLHGYVQNLAGFGLKPSSRLFERRMQYAPTRARTKFDGFHISAHVPAKNAPDFTLPNRDTPKSRPILGLNRRRGAFRGVCNTPLHGYVQNLSGFTFPHTDTPKTHPILPFPIGIHRKPTRFYTQTFVEGFFGAYAIRPYTGTCKIWWVPHFRIRIRQKRTRFYLSQ